MIQKASILGMKENFKTLIDSGAEVNLVRPNCLPIGTDISKNNIYSKAAYKSEISL